MTLRLFVLRPAVVLKARVTDTTFTYPISSVGFGSVTYGSWSNVRTGMTVMFGSKSLDSFGDSRGRQRVRWATSSRIHFGRSSQGTGDGEVSLEVDDYITVLDDFRVWAKIGYIDGDVIYKDTDLTVSDRTTVPPPVANAGVPAAGTIDAGTGKLKVQLPHGGNNSFATADGASIVSYGWEFPAGVTLDPGYSATNSQIVANFPAGFHWVHLTVTDSNGKAHQAHTFVYARDPAADTTVQHFDVVRHTVRPEGQEVAVRIYDDIPLGANPGGGDVDYPDGTLVILFEGEPSSPSDRSNLRFWGWHDVDPAEIEYTRTGHLRGVTLECVDVAGRLQRLPGFSVSVMNDGLRDAEAEPAITWAYMTNPHMDKFMHYLLHWHSNALNLADWVWSGTGANYPFTYLEAGGASLFEQVNRKAQALVPDHLFVCDMRGRLWVRPDPMLVENAPGKRTSTIQATLDGWSQLRYVGQRRPNVYQVRESAVLAHLTSQVGMFALAPGKTPGQGGVLEENGEQLARSQEDLNVVAGNRYARLNARQSLFEVSFVADGHPTIEPAALTWVRLTLTEEMAAQRGLFLTSSDNRGLVREMSIRYEMGKTGLVRQVDVVWERETWGPPGVTSNEFWG